LKQDIFFDSLENFPKDHAHLQSLGSIGIVIPTFQAANHLSHCLPPLLDSPLNPRLLIIDSSSTDGTVSLARSLGVEVMVIPQSEFNHGATREKGRKYLKTSIVIMMTQDAYAVSKEMLGYLVNPILEGKASVAYARQLPHHGASVFAAFARHFNYPPTSHIRSLAEASTYGVYTFFCSNSCAAYLNTALDEVGGFPSVRFGEDTVVVAKLLEREYRVAYVAEAQVRHSHDYTLRQEFRRHFEMGWTRRAYQKILSRGGSDSLRGRIYVQSLLKELWETSPGQIPYAFLQTLAKWTGYRLGQASFNISMCGQERKGNLSPDS